MHRWRMGWQLAGERELAMATEQKAKRARDTRVGVGAVRALAIIILILVFLAATLALLFSVWALWPPAPPVTAAGATPAPDTYGPFGWNREQNLLLLVGLLGALGAMGYVIRSFIKYVGERNLVWSWVPLYLLTPLIGAIMATATYIILRAGLLGTAAGGAEIGNTWGFAAVAILVGLFSAQAASKLKQVFETLFTAPEPGGESAASNVEAKINAVNPSAGRVGDPVALVGEGIEDVTVVRFGGNKPAAALFDDAAAVLRTVVPEGAQDGKLSVTLSTGATLESPDSFRVQP